MSSQTKLKENEVMLKATHTIDLGKATLDPKNVILSKDARELLATDKKKFT
jgi:hypothetical protein